MQLLNLLALRRWTFIVCAVLVLLVVIAWFAQSLALMVIALTAARLLALATAGWIVLFVYHWLRLRSSRHADPANAELRHQAQRNFYGLAGNSIDACSAESLFKQAYSQGDRLAGCELYFVIHAKPGANEEHCLAIWQDCYWAMWWQQRRGNPEAQFLAALTLSGSPANSKFGRLVQKNLDRCIKAGYVQAMYLRAVMYESGHGVAAEPELAFHWFEKVAAADCVLGFSGLGRLLSNPDYSGFDIQRALPQLEQAAARNDNAALLRLAELHERGTGIPADPQQAREYYGKVQGSRRSIALTRLARMLLDGAGGEADRAAARRLLEEAVQYPRDNEEARQLLAETGNA